MTSKNNKYSRRDFLKTAGVAGAGAVIAPHLTKSNAFGENKNMAVPTRPFGKTGISVPILSLGGMFDTLANQIILKLAIKWGITYWDTSHMYGFSETGIGHYFKNNPDHRKKIFLVTKPKARDLEGMKKQFELSLKRLNTSYIDLYFFNMLENINVLNDDVRKWAESLKKQGKIKLFGFSTHKNMEKSMMNGAKLDWIDGIMTAYNFRLMHKPSMKEAIQACAEKGIGLTAMKTQGGGSIKTETETEVELAGRFVRQGFTNKQAKLKAVWEDKRIASICSQMPDTTILMSNIAAALDKTSLAVKDMDILKKYACETSSDYCAGCGHICEAEVNGKVPISDIMRYLMYNRCYNQNDLARQMHGTLPPGLKRQIKSTDFSTAERKCPQNMAIAKLMKEAAGILA